MAARLARLTWTYGISNGSERAQHTCHFLSPAGQPLVDLRDELQPLTDALWGVQRALHPTRVELLALRLDEININNGHVITGLDITRPSAPLGSRGVNQLPPECTPVLTIRTNFVGGSYRGRMYLPPLGIDQVNADGAIVQTTQEGLVDAFATFFQDLDAGLSDYKLGVYSRTLIAWTAATAVDMGVIMDVQRSRRKSLVEARYRVDL